MNKTRRTPLVSKLIVCMLALPLTALPFPTMSGPTPFKGKGTGQIVSVVPTPAGVEISVIGEGNSTHLGRFERQEEILLDPADGTFTGSIVFTAANGDQLRCSLSGGFTG